MLYKKKFVSARGFTVGFKAAEIFVEYDAYKNPNALDQIKPALKQSLDNGFIYRVTKNP